MVELLSGWLQDDVRYRLLELLFVERHEASARSLARWLEVQVNAIAGAIEQLVDRDLVRARFWGNARLFKANWGHSDTASLLRGLYQAPAPDPERVERLRESLVAYGAPLMGVSGVPHFPLEETLLKGLRAAWRDATILRVLPVLVASSRHRLDWRRLADRAKEVGLQAEVGLMLELTGDLLADDALRSRSRPFRTNTRPHMRYFPAVRSKYERPLAVRTSPPVAKAWGFYMNVSIDSFASLLAKHYRGYRRA